jgi:hypothetical protein
MMQSRDLAKEILKHFQAHLTYIVGLQTLKEKLPQSLQHLH